MKQTPARPRGLLEPCAATSGKHGSEGASAQQCAGATRHRVRRPDRRPAGPPALRPVCRKQCLDHLCRDDPQPAARRRHPHQRSARRRPRCDAPPSNRHRPRPAGPPTTETSAAPASALALGKAMDCPMGQGVSTRNRTTGPRLNQTSSPHRPDRRSRGTAGPRPADQACHANDRDQQSGTKITRPAGSRIEAKPSLRRHQRRTKERSAQADNLRVVAILVAVPTQTRASQCVRWPL